MCSMLARLKIKSLAGNSAITEVNELKKYSHYSIQIYVLDFPNANLNFFTFITQINFLKEMLERKHEKDLFSFDFKSKPPEKVSSK